MNPLAFVLIRTRRMCKVYSAHSFMLPSSTKLVLVVQKTELFNNVIHDEIGVDLGFVCHMLFVRLT